MGDSAKGTVLVTGATSGIGRLTADLFAARGWRVVAAGRSVAALDRWGEEHPGHLVEQLDVTDPSSVDRAVRGVVSRWGRVDVLVNNAGFGLYGPLEGMALDGFADQLATNTLGVVSMTQAVVPVMRETGSGAIVNVTSIGGRTSAPFMSAYSASKFAVEGLSESLFYELGAHGIRVKVVEPGHFRTSFLDHLSEQVHPAYAQAYANHMSWVRHGQLRAPTAERVAAAIYRAATDRSRRLRYPVRGRSTLLASRLLPWGAWSRLAGGSMTRPRR
ncbi:MAG: SDR family oxidoreductase [Candidatus Nanopelagicales bacterium]